MTDWARTIIEEWPSVELPEPPPLVAVEIDPTTTALLLLDFTNQTCTRERRPRCAASVPKLAKLLADARSRAMFVVFSVPGSATPADILAELAPAAGEPVLPPLGPDKFIGSDLEARLKQRGIRTLIVTGTAANTSVLHTAGEATLRGFDVVVPVDAMSSNDAFSELYTAWHLAHAARISARARLTAVVRISYAR